MIRRLYRFDDGRARSGNRPPPLTLAARPGRALLLRLDHRHGLDFQLPRGRAQAGGEDLARDDRHGDGRKQQPIERRPGRSARGQRPGQKLGWRLAHPAGDSPSARARRAESGADAHTLQPAWYCGRASPAVSTQIRRSQRRPRRRGGDYRHGRAGALDDDEFMARAPRAPVARSRACPGRSARAPELARQAR